MKAKTIKHEIYREWDSILPDITFTSPALIEVQIGPQYVSLQIGPRDWEWDRANGRMVGSGTIIGSQPRPRKRQSKIGNRKSKITRRHQ